jgi:hypothetical protein
LNDPCPAPEVVDQAVAGEDLPQVECEVAEERARLRSSEVDGLAVAEDLEGTEQPELDSLLRTHSQFVASHTIPVVARVARPDTYEMFGAEWTPRPDPAFRLGVILIYRLSSRGWRWPAEDGGTTGLQTSH